MNISLPFEYSATVSWSFQNFPARDKALREPSHFPGASPHHGRDGVLLEFVPETRDRWIGCFAFGSPANAISCVIGSPNPDQAYVISSGAGYIVRVDEPTNWEMMRAKPVWHALAIPSADLVVFGDFTKLFRVRSQRIDLGIRPSIVRRTQRSAVFWRPS